MLLISLTVIVTNATDAKHGRYYNSISMPSLQKVTSSKISSDKIKQIMKIDVSSNLYLTMPFVKLFFLGHGMNTLVKYQAP